MASQVDSLSAPTGVARVDSRASRRNAGSGRPRISQVPYLPGLDGMRAIAVVAVMVYHANSTWLAGGYLGVEVFFVISGYLITLLIIAEHERSGALDLRAFWLRRARRLLPALFVMLLLLSVWVALFERDALGKLRGDIIAGLFYGSNWYQVWIGAGYSAGSDFAPLRHLWSLAVEEQFYLLWPLVMLLFIRSGSRRIARSAGWLFVAALAVTVIVALLHHPSPQQTADLTPEAYWFIGDRAISKPDALYLGTFSRAGGLLLGAAFAMLWRPAAIMRGPLRDKGRWLDVLALVGFAALAVMAVTVTFQPDQGVHWFLFRGGGLFFTGVATLALIAAVTHRGTYTSRLLAVPLLMWIGTRSYGLYLFHWPIYQIIRNIAANKLVLHEFVLAIAATVVITEFSYRLIEMPIRRGQLGEIWRRRRSMVPAGQRKGAIAGAFVGTALAVYAGASIATAELKQNSVQQSLDEGGEFVCDTLRDLDCDGELDVDDDGQPLETAAGGATTDQDVGDPPPADGEPVATSGDTASEAVDPATGAAPDSAVDELEVPPASTEPPLPVAERIAVGDSVMRGAAGDLSGFGFVVDAVESRSWSNGVTYVQRLGEAGRLPETMVVHLGTNGPISASAMTEMMTAIADVPTVVLVTNDVDRDYTDDNNTLIFDAAAANPNVQVLYWHELASSCPGDCFESDGLHLKPDGQAYYAALVAGVLGIS